MADFPDAAAVRRALERKFRTSTMDGYGPWVTSEFPKAAAEVAMTLVGPVLEERDAEIRRLRGLPVKDGSEGDER